MSHEQQPLIAGAPAARSVEFTIPGTPVAKGRPRFSRRGAHVHVHTPVKTENYEGLVKFIAHTVMAGSEPYAGPVRLIVEIGVPIPTSWSQKRQRAAAAGEIGATKKPDADNVVKALKDGMNGVVYVDDGQVVDLWVAKRYALVPGVRVEAIELNLQRA